MASMALSHSLPLPRGWPRRARSAANLEVQSLDFGALTRLPSALNPAGNGRQISLAHYTMKCPISADVKQTTLAFS